MNNALYEALQRVPEQPDFRKEAEDLLKAIQPWDGRNPPVSADYWHIMYCLCQSAEMQNQLMSPAQITQFGQLLGAVKSAWQAKWNNTHGAQHLTDLMYQTLG